MRDATFMLLMRAVPKAALSSAVGALVRVPAPSPVVSLAVRAFSRRFGVDLSESARAPGEFRTFGEFFGRRLRPGLRPVAPGEKVIVSPVDGTVYNTGVAERGTMIQAKGKTYTVAELVASAEDALAFEGGAYATLYLAPRDYHRIHAPVGGEIVRYTYVPGAFWPVNPASVGTMDKLFATNERLITYLRTSLGQVAVVKVGATCVARIRALYADVHTHGGLPRRLTRTLLPRPVAVDKGGEVGVFEMGSTVILLFEPGRARLRLAEGQRVRMGEAIGEALVSAVAG